MHRHEVYNKNDDMNNLFKIYHQNIRGLKHKINEFILSFLAEAPHNLPDWTSFEKLWNRCYSHLQIQTRSKILRKGIKKLRCLYIHPRNFKFSNINLQKHCKEQEIEIAAVQLKLGKKNVIIFCVCRAPSGNLDYFLNKLDNILSSFTVINLNL